jgi:hypothetical protein
VTDLADFLLARIAEDERLARDAEATWSQVRIHYGTSANADQRFAREAFVLNINPWRVLAECEAKRRIVEFLGWEIKDARSRPGWTIPDDEVDEKGRAYRSGVEHQKAKQLPDALDRNDRLLRLLALPYAHHPDYREEWRG